MKGDGILGRKILWVVEIWLMLFLSGCSNPNQEVKQENTYRIYYINKNATKVVYENYDTKETDQELLLKEFLERLQTDSNNVDYRKPIPSNVTVVKASVNNGLAVITFDAEYLKTDNITEILCRAAIVRTLTQIEGIKKVSIYVNEQPLIDRNGNPVGVMKASDFIDDLGGDINDYQRTTLNLYFANATGDKLVEESREVVYSNSISMERLVIEQLVKGPSTEGLNPVLPSDIKLISVTTKDGICYVNFEESFLTSPVNAIEIVPIYALVNSLVELPHVNKVQIAINGESKKKYREVVSLDTLFERNLDLVEVLKPNEETKEVETEGLP